jgi:hypothetical protein
MTTAPSQVTPREGAGKPNLSKKKGNRRERDCH